MSLLASIFTPWSDAGFSSQLFWDLGFIGLFLIGVQAVLTLVVGHHGDTGADCDGFAWSNFISLKTIAAMFLGVGFGGAALGDSGFPLFVAAAGGMGIGILLSAFFVVLMRGFYQLRADGTVRLWEAIGHHATVYLPIPGEETAPGEIQVCFGGRMMNVQAFTKGPALPTGTDVLVKSVRGDHALEVEKASDDQLKLD